MFFLFLLFINFTYLSSYPHSLLDANDGFFSFSLLTLDDTMIQKVPNSKNVTLNDVYIILNVYDGAGDISIQRYVAVIICNHNHFYEPSLCRFLLVESLNDVYWLLTRVRVPSIILWVYFFSHYLSLSRFLPPCICHLFDLQND